VRAQVLATRTQRGHSGRVPSPAEPTDDRPDPLLQHLINLTREGTVVAAFQAAHDKFHRLHADCLRLAPTATTDDEALNELLQTLDVYTTLFNEHHHAEDHYFFPALRQAEPALNAVVEQLVAQHEQLAVRLTVVVEQARRRRSGEGSVDGPERLVEAVTDLQVAVDKHLLFEEAETVPALSTWTDWPI
jgi:iron-sulfur cluster repair protein YtfE (RIC family)